MHSQRGFTLVEMSIVLVIIALLAAGIVVGQTMIRESQLQAVLGEYDRYSKAIQEFQDKYQALPGDFSNAQNLWGILAAGKCAGTTAVTTLPTSTATCNGDATGTIGTSTTAGVVTNLNTGATTGEWWAAWQHMANAGLIDGSFTGGGYTTTTTYAVPGYNVPASKMTPGGWTLLYYLNVSGGTKTWPDNYGHILSFGAPDSGVTNFTYYAILTPIEALELDKKIDDGKPGTGKVRAWRNGTNASLANCAVESTQIASTYTAGISSAPACSLIFLLGM